ncbi:VWA domain-containing protein [Neobacillus notoginsengisoli]|uniref:VWA domain-containing protein n=1 Tax=Neobacillus notoginsengisoli TaxID=1578198 RepID=A0A417YPN1_9BACI|nr:VWA domain-containing protein [Neobacillus notoginsengisoli]RHW35755.1 VWA domain-containing protein [Neobacillus notoginsengisoli]
MKRARLIFLLLLTALLLIGCQEKEELKAVSKNETKGWIEPGKTISISEEVELPKTTAKEYIEAEKGELYTKFIESKEFSEDKEAIEKANADAVDAYFAQISKKKTKNWDEKKWAESITFALRASYKDVAEEMENYEVVYEKLRLPDGRLLEDISMDEITKEEDKSVNVVLVIDSSGSMKAKIGGESKMALAKKSIESLAKELPESVNVSLIAFGHQGSGSDADKAKSCSAVESMYPLKAYEGAAFGAALNKFEAVGWTPLASAITMANEQLGAVSGENTENFIYVVSDGIETCDGDPVAAAKKAVADNNNVKINIIGFDVDSEADKQLKAVAEAGGGEYSSVKTKQQLAEIKDVWKEAVNINTWRWWAVHRFADNVWTTLDHNNAVGKINSKYFTIYKNEDKRIRAAVDRLRDEGLIDSKGQNGITQIIRDRDDKIQTYMSDINSTKRDEIKTKSDELSEKLDVIKKQVGL